MCAGVCERERERWIDRDRETKRDNKQHGEGIRGGGGGGVTDASAPTVAPSKSRISRHI